jgi:hypothetical protein
MVILPSARFGRAGCIHAARKSLGGSEILDEEI